MGERHLQKWKEELDKELEELKDALAKVGVVCHLHEEESFGK